MITRSDLHNNFFEFLKQIKPKNEFVDVFTLVFMKRFQERKKELKDEYQEKTEEISELEKEQEWLIDKGSQGIIPDSVLKKKLTELEEKISLVKLGLNETLEEEFEVEALLNEAVVFIRTPELA